MKIKIIVAMGLNRGIGVNGSLPWNKQHADMTHFVVLTSNKPIIVGRKTYESFPRRPLPRRTNIVITGNSNYAIFRRDNYEEHGIKVAKSLEMALSIAREENPDYCSVVGGASVYQEALAIADVIELTQIEQYFASHTFFPRFNPEQWRERKKEFHPADESNEYSYSFITLDRVRP